MMNIYNTQCTPKKMCMLALAAVVSLPFSAAMATNTRVLYFYHGSGPMTAVYDEANNLLLEQAWTPTGERVQLTSESRSLKNQQLDGLPTRWTARGVDLFDTDMQLTPSGLYNQNLYRNSNSGVK